MAGNANTTVIAELNRLANGGGSYPSQGTWLDEDIAACTWAGVDTSHTMLHALNAKAGNTAAQFLDLNGVCNQLAGTDGSLGAPEALRRIAS